MSKAAETKKETNTSVNIRARDRSDKERFVGTIKSTYLVQTEKDVSVPGDVKEAVMLSKMQNFFCNKKISELELKTAE